MLVLALLLVVFKDLAGLAFHSFVFFEADPDQEQEGGDQDDDDACTDVDILLVRVLLLNGPEGDGL